MIRNDIELGQSIEQLERMYRVLAELKSRVEEADPQRFQMMAEGPADEIRRLRADIDSYLGVAGLVEQHGGRPRIGFRASFRPSSLA